MLELGKRDNGVTIFDKEKLVKVDITGEKNSDFLVSFDTRAYDELMGPKSMWFIYSLGIVRKDNPDLCLPFDDFFTKAYELIINNQERFEKYCEFNSNCGVLRRLNNGNIQINYPSDDDSFKKGTMLGVTKYKDLGYSLNFDKNPANLRKLSHLIKSYGGHFEDLARIYIDCFTELCEMDVKPYSVCQNDFLASLNTRRMK